MKFPTAPLLATIALIGAAAGFLAYRHYAAVGPTLAPALAPPPAAPATAPAPVATIPLEVPDLALTDLAGRRHPLRDGSGRPHLYNFWATWCEPCRREIPLLNTLQLRYRADRLQVVGIAVDFRDSVRQFLRTTPLNYTLLVGEEDGYEAAQKFGMELALPFSVFADDHDRIIAVKVGELHREEADAILGQMRSLREGKTSLQQARAAINEVLRQSSIARAKQSQKN